MARGGRIRGRAGFFRGDRQTQRGRPPRPQSGSRTATWTVCAGRRRGLRPAGLGSGRGRAARLSRGPRRPMRFQYHLFGRCKLVLIK